MLCIHTTVGMFLFDGMFVLDRDRDHQRRFGDFFDDADSFLVQQRLAVGCHVLDVF
jgi:hypothetical protein